MTIGCCLMLSQACNKVPPPVRKVIVNTADDAANMLRNNWKKTVPVPKPHVRPTPPKQSSSEAAGLLGKFSKKALKQWSKEDKEKEEEQNELVQNPRTLKNPYLFPEK